MSPAGVSPKFSRYVCCAYLSQSQEETQRAGGLEGKVWNLNRLFTRDLDSAEGWPASECSMGPLEVVVAHPGPQGAGAQGRVAVRHRVGPLLQPGLDEALGLAVGAGTLGSGPEVTDPQGRAGGGKAPRAVTGAVVGQDAFDAHPQPVESRDGAPEERGAGHALLVAWDLDVAHARGIIDGDVHVLPAGTLTASTPKTRVMR